MGTLAWWVISLDVGMGFLTWFMWREYRVEHIASVRRRKLVRAMVTTAVMVLTFYGQYAQRREIVSVKAEAAAALAHAMGGGI